MKNLKLLIFLSFTICAIITAKAQAPAKAYGDYYQITVYHTNSRAQLDSVSAYLQTTKVPQWHQAGFNTVGVFFPLTNDTAADKRIVVWIPLKTLTQLHKVEPDAGAPKYQRMENIILTAFEKAPHYQLPKLNGQREGHIFELRSYESPTEERYLSKVKMFNAGGEVPLFARLGFNAVFYAHVLAGSRMPNLMYMTSFDNQTTHDAHWKAFSDDAEWKKLSGSAEYQKNVNKHDIILMHPAEYSDVW